jgi:hypothetical protein
MRALVATMGWIAYALAVVGLTIVAGASLTYGHGERKVTVGSERVTAGPSGGTAEPVNMKNPGPHR